jgi:hypothetical protein
MKHLWQRFKAAYRAFIEPQPLPRALLPPTIQDDAYPVEPMQLRLKNEVDLGEPSDQPHENREVDLGAKKPRRPYKRKPKTPVLVAVPDAPQPEEWLRKLREKRRFPIDNPEAERLPPATSVARIRDRTLYRLPGESVQGFIDRVRASVGDARVSWSEEPADPTRLSIIENALHRPLKAAEDLDFSSILAEDLNNIRPPHSIIH